MSDLPLTIPDLVAIGIVILSGLIAYWRGAVREFLFLATWGGSALATVFLYNETYPFVHEWIGQDALLAAVANAVGLFTITLVLMVLVTSLIVSRVDGSSLNVLDRSLGFVFGLIRGGLIVCLIYLAYSLLAPAAEHPDWLRNARLTPLVARCTVLVVSIVPDEWGLKAEHLMHQAEDGLRIIDQYENLVNPQPVPPEGGEEGEHGYSDEEREVLEDIIGTDE